MPDWLNKIVQDIPSPSSIGCFGERYLPLQCKVNVGKPEIIPHQDEKTVSLKSYDSTQDFDKAEKENNLIWFL